MRVRIPPQDIPAIDLATGRLTLDWYDAIKALERLGLLDLADVTVTPPADTNTVRWSAAQGKFIFGA